MGRQQSSPSSNQTKDRTEQRFDSYRHASPKLHLSTNDTVHSPNSLRNAPHLLGGSVEILGVVADSFVRRQGQDLLSRPMLQSASVRCAIHHSPGWPKRLLGLRAAIKIVSHSLLFANSLLANQHSWGMIREVRESYTNPCDYRRDSFQAFFGVFSEYNNWVLMGYV
jgi:hypothetical protein